MIAFKNNCFYLNTANTCYCIEIAENGALLHRYYGKRIAAQSLDYFQNGVHRPSCFPVCINGCVTTYSELPYEYGAFGRGDTRFPSFKIEDDNGRVVSELKYVSHKITCGKPPLEGLPQLCADANDTQTLEITADDIVSGIRIMLYYSVFEETDIISRHTRAVNNTEKTVYIKQLDSLAMDFPPDKYELITLYGSWARERWIERYPLHHGISSVGSTAGITGHGQNPFAALVTPQTTENSGDVYGFALIYSGDFRFQAQIGQFETTRISLGINSENFIWELKPHKEFCSPEAVMTYSSDGLNGMSQSFHKMCRKYLGACSAKNIKRPIVLNLWEAMYFDSDEEKILKMIELCRDTGIDTVVLDDGWYGRRKDENGSLGDWYVNREKFPQGFKKILSACKKNNMGLGVWIEPEAVNRDSELYRAHPDWCISLPNVKPLESRNELVLDYGRPEVVDGMYNILYKLLHENDIKYVKWDMNRSISDNGSVFLEKRRQGEQNHRFILGVYELMARLTKSFPDVFFEGCSSGGARFDLGILYYMPQIWTSDDTDAYERSKIQYGTSLLYPPETMSAHITICPNHQTGRTVSFNAREAVAALFSFGYELNLNNISEDEMRQIPLQTKRRKFLEANLANAVFYRLCSPFEGDCAAWQAVSENGEFSAAVYLSSLNIPNGSQRSLKLTGLKPETVYEVRPCGIRLSGSLLMNMGLPIPAASSDFEAHIFILKALKN